MGCWNETDALTQLPIMPRDSVKLIVVTAYDEELTFARCFPISGEYNDYGSIDNIKEDWATKAFLAYVNEQFEKGKWAFAAEEKERIKIFKVKYPFETTEEVLRAIEREFVVSKEWHPTETPVFFVMIHEALYDKAITMTGNYKESVEQRIAKVFASFDDELLLTTLEEFEPELQRKLLPGRLSMLLSERLFSVVGSLGGSYLRGVYGDSCFGGIHEREAASKEDYINRLVELACLNLFMRLTRRKFYKQAGSGSQDSEFELAADFFSFAKDFALKKQSEAYEEE